jgi:hypothetical protein
MVYSDFYGLLYVCLVKFVYLISIENSLKGYDNWTDEHLRITV